MIKPAIRTRASSGGTGSPFVLLEQKRWRARILISLLLLLLLITAAEAVRVGAVPIPVSDLLGILGLVPASPYTVDPVKGTIILELRLPRVVLAALVGASLAVAGATFQALFRNPMADPYSSGCLPVPPWGRRLLKCPLTG